jgi:hypothetical protein
MEKFPFSSVCLLLLIIICAAGCNKENVLPGEFISQPSANQTATPEHITFNNITIDSAAIYVFSVPAVTRSIVDSGSINAYALDAADPTQQWQSLPIINSCSSRLDISTVGVGTIQIQNNLGKTVTFSYAFDITPGN